MARKWRRFGRPGESFPPGHGACAPTQDCQEIPPPRFAIPASHNERLRRARSEKLRETYASTNGPSSISIAARGKYPNYFRLIVCNSVFTCFSGKLWNFAAIPSVWGVFNMMSVVRNLTLLSRPDLSCSTFNRPLIPAKELPRLPISVRRGSPPPSSLSSLNAEINVRASWKGLNLINVHFFNRTYLSQRALFFRSTPQQNIPNNTIFFRQNCWAFAQVSWISVNPRAIICRLTWKTLKQRA